MRTRLWLAPLAGVTDFTFRTICKSWGADIMVSEMVSADGLHFSPKQTLPYAEFDECQRPFAIQIFGSEPEIMSEAVHTLSELKPDMIDVNMGCPVKKVVKRNAGSALMKNPPLAESIVSAVKGACKIHNLPLSVKFRAGWDNSSINAVDFAMRMENAGADYVIIHPRTRSQMFSGKSNWQIIRDIKDKVAIPVVGNGDIFTPEDAKRMLEETGCDEIMIGRGVMGKPWIFKQIREFLENGTKWQPEPYEIIDTVKRHINLKIAEKNAEKALLEMRNHLSAYTKGYSGSAKVRNLINSTTDVQAVLEAIELLILSD